MTQPAPATERALVAQAQGTGVPAVAEGVRRRGRLLGPPPPWASSASRSPAILIGPGQRLVAAEVDFSDTATVADVERASDEAERRLVARHPGVRYVFLDPTPGNGRARVAAPPVE